MNELRDIGMSPLASAWGVSGLQSWQACDTGLLYDRQCAVADLDHGRVVNARSNPRVSELQVILTEGGKEFTLFIPELDPVTLPLGPVARAPRRHVYAPRTNELVLAEDIGDKRLWQALSDFLGERVVLVRGLEHWTSPVTGAAVAFHGGDYQLLLVDDACGEQTMGNLQPQLIASGELDLPADERFRLDIGGVVLLGRQIHPAGRDTGPVWGLNFPAAAPYPSLRGGAEIKLVH